MQDDVEADFWGIFLKAKLRNWKETYDINDHETFWEKKNKKMFPYCCVDYSISILTGVDTRMVSYDFYGLTHLGVNYRVAEYE